MSDYCQCWFSLNTGPNGECERCGKIFKQGEKRMVDQRPRRSDINQWVPAEKAIAAAMVSVEEMPADPRLTDAVVLLGKAREYVSDFVDGIPRKSKPIIPPLESSQPIYIALIQTMIAKATKALDRDPKTITMIDDGSGRWTSAAAELEFDAESGFVVGEREEGNAKNAVFCLHASRIKGVVVE